MTTGWRHPKPPIRSRSRRHRRRGVLFLISFFFCFFFLRTHSVICEKKVPPSDFFFRFVHVFFSGRNFAKGMRHPRRARRSTIRQRRAGCRRGCARRCRFYFFDDFFFVVLQKEISRPTFAPSRVFNNAQREGFLFFLLFLIYGKLLLFF